MNTYTNTLLIFSSIYITGVSRVRILIGRSGLVCAIRNKLEFMCCWFPLVGDASAYRIFTRFPRKHEQGQGGEGHILLSEVYSSLVNDKLLAVDARRLHEASRMSFPVWGQIDSSFEEFQTHNTQLVNNAALAVSTAIHHVIEIPVLTYIRGARGRRDYPRDLMSCYISPSI